MENQQNIQREQQIDEESEYSSEDEDGKLLTNKVQQKLLTVVAKLKAKDPSLYGLNKPIFEDDDFQNKNESEKQKLRNQKQNNKNSKVTYQNLAAQMDEGDSDENNQVEKQLDLDQIKENFKRKLKNKQQNEQDKNDDDLFKIKKKVQQSKKSDQQKLKQFVSVFDKQSGNLLTNLWTNEKKLDKTDLFLRNYIINEKWKTSKLKKDQLPLNQQKQQMIDEQDQQRSIQMDEYEQQYNFRFQEPNADKIVQYPREVPQSMRAKPETRKQKRQKLAQRKKQQQQQIRKQAEQKKQQKKQQILQKIKQHEPINDKEENEQSSDFEHDWFFCDDCVKPLQQKQLYYVCNECGQYMLCQQCHEIIIHKHQMEKAVIPKGAGPPATQKVEKALKKLTNCKSCRKKIPHYLPRYEYSQKFSRVVDTICQKCYDEATLQLKKKFKLVEPKNTHINYEQLLQKDPQKVKQLNNQKDIQQLVDQYIKYDFEDVIGGGLKTKFKYISVKPQSYGLSDEQILYGDDKEMNKYVSIKKLGAYEDQDLKLRNSIYNRKIKSISKSALQNKKILMKSADNGRGLRMMKKLQTRADILRKRRQSKNKKLRIVNISKPEDEKNYLLPKSRLQSYGLISEEGYNRLNNKNNFKDKKPNKN